MLTDVIFICFSDKMLFAPTMLEKN